MPGLLDRAARSFGNHRIGRAWLPIEVLTEALSAVRLRAVAHSGNIALRQTCTHDACRATASSVTIRIMSFLHGLARQACVRSWRTHGDRQFQASPKDASA